MTASDMERLWLKLSDNQRLRLMNDTLPWGKQVSEPYYIAASRALDRLGLTGSRAQALAEWAHEHGFARQDGPAVRGTSRNQRVPSWTFRAPEPSRRSLIDPTRLAELVDEGQSASAVAAEFGVTRSAVYLAVKRQGLALAPRPRKQKAPRPRRVLRPRHVTFCVSVDEHAAIQRAAARRDLKVSGYLRELLCAADIASTDQLPAGTSEEPSQPVTNEQEEASA